jgi:hypothetical protein
MSDMYNDQIIDEPRGTQNVRIQFIQLRTIILINFISILCSHQSKEVELTYSKEYVSLKQLLSNYMKRLKV